MLSISVCINKFVTSLKNILFPINCLGCDSENIFLCAKCLTKVSLKIQPLCPYCQKISQLGLTCSECLKNSPYLKCLLVGSDYNKDSLLIQSLHVLKYESIKELAEPLAILMNDFILLEIPWRTIQDHTSSDENFPELSAIIFCPIPLHKKREQQRGFNQAELLLKKLNPEPPFYKINLLKRIHFKKAQIELRQHERKENIKNAFAVDEKSLKLLKKLTGIENKFSPIIVLVDDVATTLSTLEEAAKTLKNIGIKRIYGLVLARKITSYEN